MKLAIASGKGGTGKTTVATNLACALAEAGERVAYLDCDVEEPNGHLFLRPEVHEVVEATVPVPAIDPKSCTRCGACAEACRYGALALLPDEVLVFPKLCHGCGACSLVCPEQAIREVPRKIGVVERGVATGRLAFVGGRLDVGEPMAPPLIRAVRAMAPPGHLVIIDAPPGTSCPVVESVRHADLVVLVTEPTPFGLSDLELAVGMVRLLGLPFGVFVNRAGTGDGRVHDYCEREGIVVLGDLPHDRQIAEACSRGELVCRTMPRVGRRLLALHARAMGLARAGASWAPRAGRRTGSTAAPVGRAAEPPSEAPGLEALEPPREVVVLSGKGGTGKTSVVASLVALEGEAAAAADCDVDAADLHLVLDPRIEGRWPFSSGLRARVDDRSCVACGLCQDHCRFGAIRPASSSGTEVFSVDPIACEGCGVCAVVCPARAVDLVRLERGQWYVSESRFGPLVHARLGIAEASSGRLASLVRREGRALASLRGRGLLVVDGSPGIGCPVIASVTGADLVLVVTEPTVSGLHDLERVLELVRHFGIEAAVCVNKADVNPELASRLAERAERLGARVLGRIRYDERVTAAQLAGRPVVELADEGAAADLRELWARLRERLDARPEPRGRRATSAGGQVMSRPQGVATFESELTRS